MKAPVSWIREYVDLPEGLSTEDLAARLTALGLKLEALDKPGHDLRGPLVVGRVLTKEAEPQKNGKTINWCTVDVGEANGTGEPQGIVCGAHNFEPGDLVVVVLPGAALPGGLEISARRTYGHVSAGMICSATELGLEDPSTRDGIIVLPADAGSPGDDAFGVLPLRDEVIEFEINPDRAYALSLRGVARDAALGFDAPFHDPADRETPPVDGGSYPVVVDDPQGCPVFVTRTVTGFDPSAPTPKWLARRVQLAGMRPISLAVDVTNYVMLELGQPLHGYDGDKLSGPIRVRRATPGERLTTLDSVERTLSPEDLLITDDSGPIGLAGVMGGENTELSATTSHVVIEAAHFDPVTIFRSQRRHKLPSEASKRFERGVDPRLPEAAADRVAELLARYGGGTVSPSVTKVGDAPAPRTVTITDRPPRHASPAWTSPPTPRSRTCAPSAATSRSTATGSPRWCRAGAPTSRNPSTWSRRWPGSSATRTSRRCCRPPRRAAGSPPPSRCAAGSGRTLAGAGFVEVVNFPFVGTGDLDRLGLDADDERRTTMRIANPISSEEPMMTTTLLPGLLKALARNAGRGLTDAALFETATVTLPRGTVAAPILPVDRRPTEGEWDDLQKALPDQPLHLALGLAGNRERGGWWGAGRPAGWADAIESVRGVAAALGVEVTVRSATRAPWHPGRCAEVLVGEVTIGYAGELHPRVCAAYGVPARTAVAEVDLDQLLERATLIVPGAAVLDLPGRQGGRRARRRRRGAGGRGGRHAPGGGRRAVRVGAALRRLHR